MDNPGRRVRGRDADVRSRTDARPRYLANAQNWTIYNEKMRTFIADYAPTVSILIWTVVSLVGRAEDLGKDLTRLNVPRNFQTIGGRTWFLNPFELEAWAIVLALVPAAIILVLFIFDHNVSSIMAQSADFKLKKGSAYPRPRGRRFGRRDVDVPVETTRGRAATATRIFLR